MGRAQSVLFGTEDRMMSGSYTEAERCSLKGRALQKVLLSSAGSSGPVRQEFWATEGVQRETGCQVGNKRGLLCHSAGDTGLGL